MGQLVEQHAGDDTSAVRPAVAPATPRGALRAGESQTETLGDAVTTDAGDDVPPHDWGVLTIRTWREASSPSGVRCRLLIRSSADAGASEVVSDSIADVGATILEWLEKWGAGRDGEEPGPGG